jgi:signal transduction histidine kinase
MRWPRLPAPTLRLRLTVLHGVLFLVTGAVLLTLGYLLVRHNVSGETNFRAVRARLDQLHAPPGVLPRAANRPFSFAPGSPGAQVAIVVRDQLRSDALHRLLIEYIIALVVMTGVSAAGGWWLAGRALRPLRRIIATARRVSGKNLGERIELTGPADELRELGETFDGMLARLDTAFASHRHFVANASHELRTPLAIMRAELDVALDDPNARERDLRRMAEELRDTIDRCERLLGGLLMLARSEVAGRGEEPFDLAALAGDCITDLSARAREADLEFRDSLAPAWTAGEPALLERLVANLIDNAVRYNERGGFVDVQTGTEGPEAWLSVANSGPAVPAPEAERLTEPFQRLDRTPGGFGLGLSIVASVVRAHGGTMRVAPRAEGGLSIAVRLPAARDVSSVRAGKEMPALTRS